MGVSCLTYMKKWKLLTFAIRVRRNPRWPPNEPHGEKIKKLKSEQSQLQANTFCDCSFELFNLLLKRGLCPVVARFLAYMYTIQVLRVN